MEQSVKKRFWKVHNSPTTNIRNRFNVVRLVINIENWVPCWCISKSNIRNKDDFALYHNTSLLLLDAFTFFHQFNR